MAEAPDPSIVSGGFSSGIDTDETSNSKEVTEFVTRTMREFQHEARILPNQKGCDGGIQIIDGNDSQIFNKCNINVHYHQPPKLAPGKHKVMQRDTNSAQISDAEEYDSKIFRVLVFSQEMKDHNTEHMTITVWFCLDSEYKGVLVAEHEHGNITLDSHDTFRLGDGSLGEGIQRQPPVTVTMEANNSNAWNPDKYQKGIHAMQIWKAGKAKCSFKLQKEPTAKRNQLYITLTIHQEVNGERKETEFILQKRICDIRMTDEQKATLVEQDVSAHRCRADVFSVVPYVNMVSHMDEDLILTVWMCPMNESNTILKALEEEQKIHSKAKLDSENSFVILDWGKPVMADIEMNDNKWEIHNLKKQKRIETSKLSGGQTKCQFALNRLDESPDINVKISLWQAEENNGIEFCKTTKLEKFQVVDDQQQSTHIPPLMTLNIPEPKHYQGSRTSETDKNKYYPKSEAPFRTKIKERRSSLKPYLRSKVLNEEGGVLELTKYGVRLEIPRCALKEECQIQMKVQMNHSLDGNASMEIEFLPSNLQLLKPAALTYPHCLVLKKGSERKAKIQSSDHAAGCQPVWKDMDAEYHMVEDKITIMLKSFSWKRFIVSDEIVAGKNIQLFAAKNLSSTDTCTLLEIGYYWDLPGLQEDLMSDRNHAVLLHIMPAVFYKEGRHPLVAEIDKDKSTSWIYHGQNRKEITFEHVATNQWGFSSFELERKDSNMTGEITCFFKVGQDPQLVDFMVPMKMPIISRSEDPSHLTKTDRVSEGTWHDEENTVVTVEVDGVSGKFEDVCRKFGDVSSKLDDVSSNLEDVTSKLSVKDVSSELGMSSFRRLGMASIRFRRASDRLERASDRLERASDRLRRTYDRFEDVLSKLRRASVDRLEGVSSKLEEVSSKSRDASLRLGDVSSKLDDVSSNLKDVSPKVRRAALPSKNHYLLKEAVLLLEGVSSRLEDVSCKLSGVIPLLEGVSSRLEDVSCKLNDDSSRVRSFFTSRIPSRYRSQIMYPRTPSPLNSKRHLDVILPIVRKLNAMDVSSEFQAKIFRVIPLVLMSKNATQDISLIILVCEDDESLFNNDLRQLMEAEYLPLDTFDTLLINCSTIPVEVRCTLQSRAYVLHTTMKRIHVASLIESKSVKRSFRLPKREKDLSSICLLKIHQKGREPLGVSFALQIKDNNDRIEDHRSLANILLERDCQSPLTPKTDPDICFVLPYINGLRNLTDVLVVVITVWLCSFDEEALKELEHEQYHVGRIKLDSPNTFIILDKDKPITVEITGLRAKIKVQSVSTKRVSEGGHAKVQFVCLLHKVDENSWIDLDITVKQEEELNKIQFLSIKKVSKLMYIEDSFKKGKTELPGTDFEGKQEEKKE